MKKFDNSYLSETIKLIAGVDEVGRGPLAGPVVSAAVIFDPDTEIEGINDSKKLNEKRREELFPQILEKSLAYSVSVISHGKIDKINILQASLLSMSISIKRLQTQPDLILIDGNKIFNYDVPRLAIVKGDSKSFCIASASIIAKVIRDRIMKRLAVKFPEYGWEQNKGYPTKMHIEAVRKFGPSPLHRKSFLRKILFETEQTEFNV